MKYVISDKGEVNIGREGQYHADLARNFEGAVIAAGHCNQNDDGTWRVFGSSVGFRIESEPKDAEILNKYAPTNTKEE